MLTVQSLGAGFDGPRPVLLGSNSMSKIDQIIAEIKRDKKPDKNKIKSKDLLSSGSTLVNLAVSGDYRGAFAKGKYYHLVGSSGSGKTWLTLTSFAEASINKEFEGYRFIHDNPENGSLMDIKQYFGKKLYDCIEPPSGTKKEPRNSTTIEELYYNLDDAFKDGRKFIYVLDSMDVLDSKPDQKKFNQHKAASRKAKEGGSEEAGSYGTAKAKANAAGMRVVFNKLESSGCILILISQEKANLSFGSKEKTFSGGSSLKFYCHAQMWTGKVGTLKKTVKGRPEKVGIVATVDIRKNRHSGRDTKVKVPIYWGTGLDDTGSCVDYLIEKNHWKKGSAGVKATEFDLVMEREELIQHIEKENLEPKLRTTVAAVWEEIRLACVPERKMRYQQEVNE